jgi:hypothetical protein
MREVIISRWFQLKLFALLMGFRRERSDEQHHFQQYAKQCSLSVYSECIEMLMIIEMLFSRVPCSVAAKSQKQKVVHFHKQEMT